MSVLQCIRPPSNLAPAVSNNHLQIFLPCIYFLDILPLSFDFSFSDVQGERLHLEWGLERLRVFCSARRPPREVASWLRPQCRSNQPIGAIETPGSVIGSRGDAHLAFCATVADRGQEACEARDAFTRTPGSFWCPAGLCGDGGGGSAGCGGQEPVAAGPDPAAAAEVTVGAAGSCAAGWRGRRVT